MQSLRSLILHPWRSRPKHIEDQVQAINWQKWGEILILSVLQAITLNHTAQIMLLLWE